MTEFWRDLKPIDSVFYETPGEAHTLVYESDEPMKVHFKVKGPLIWLDENGDPEGYFDVHDYIDSARSTTSRTASGPTRSTHCCVEAGNTVTGL